MSSFLVFILLTFLAHARAKVHVAASHAGDAEDAMDRLVDNLANKLVDRLSIRALKASLPNHEDLDDTTLGKGWGQSQQQAVNEATKAAAEEAPPAREDATETATAASAAEESAAESRADASTVAMESDRGLASAEDAVEETASSENAVDAAREEVASTSDTAEAAAEEVAATDSAAESSAALAESSTASAGESPASGEDAAMHDVADADTPKKRGRRSSKNLKRKRNSYREGPYAEEYR